MKTTVDLHTIQNERRLWTVVIVFSVAVNISLGLLAWHVHDTPAPASPKQIRIPLPTHPLTTGKLTASRDGLLYHEFDSSFSSTVDRLNHAFQSHPDMSVEEMIARVNAGALPGQDKPCPLSWHDNEATLALHTDRLSKLSPLTAISTCADAVEQLP